MPERQRNSEKYGKAGELNTTFPRECGKLLLLQLHWFPSLLQVKLSGSHLTPLCYSFISYVQVGNSEAGLPASWGLLGHAS